MRNVSDKSCRETFSQNLCCSWDNVEKWARQAIDENVIWRMHIACWILRVPNTLGIGNTYCFSTATMVAWMHLIVMLHIHCLSCWACHMVQVWMCVTPPLWQPVMCTLESLDSAWVRCGEHWSKCVTLCNGIFLSSPHITILKSRLLHPWKLWIWWWKWDPGVTGTVNTEDKCSLTHLPGINLSCVPAPILISCLSECSLCLAWSSRMALSA